jgi:hypothetical protein
MRKRNYYLTEHRPTEWTQIPNEVYAKNALVLGKLQWNETSQQRCFGEKSMVAQLSEPERSGN